MRNRAKTHNTTNQTDNFTECYKRSLSYDHTKKHPGYWKFALALQFDCEGHEIDEETLLDAGTQVASALMGAGGFGDTVLGNCWVMSPEKVYSQEDAVIFRGELPDVPADVKPQVLQQLAAVATTATGHRYTAAQYWDGEVLKFTFAIGGGLRPVHMVDGQYQFVDVSKN
ncbi:MAG TPA: hypothetical protein VIM61_09355 [Chthoniobacterales bacterium]